jgi:hypothetical protein
MLRAVLLLELSTLSLHYHPEVAAKHQKNIEELMFSIGLISGLLSGHSRTFNFDRRKKFYKIGCKILKECLILIKVPPLACKRGEGYQNVNIQHNK